jgi:PAS domain S-box-containing protein
MRIAVVARAPGAVETSIRLLCPAATVVRRPPALAGADLLVTADLVVTDDEAVRVALVAPSADRTGARVLYLPPELPELVVRDVLALAIEQHSTAAQLASVRHLHELILDTAVEGVWVVDRSCCTTFVNGRMAAMLGYAPEEMLGTWMFDLMADGSDEVTLSETSPTSGARGEQHEFRFRRKDGSHVWALLSTAPIRGSSGEYLGAIALVTDVTERNAAEAALRSNEESLALTLESIGEGVIAIGVDGGVVRMNAMAERLTGVALEEARSRPLHDVLRLFADPGCTVPAVVGSARSDAPDASTRRLWIRSRAGAVCAVADAASPMVDARGQVCGSVVVLRDLSSEQRAAEAE